MSPVGNLLGGSTTTTGAHKGPFQLKMFPGRPQEQQSPNLLRHPGPQQGHQLASVQHLLREVSQPPLLLHGLRGPAMVGRALLLGQLSGGPPRPPAPRCRAGGLQLGTLLLVVLGVAGESLAAAEVLLLHGAAHVLLARPRGRGPLLGVLAKVDNNDVALEIHYLST